VGFAEPPLLVYADESKKKALPDHPLQALIKRPNPFMGEDEFWKYMLTYAPTGGNAYAKIVANNGGEPTELWPYHDMVMWPVPGRMTWIDHYAYSLDNGHHVEDIPIEEIVHFKWAIDPETPWKGLSALGPVGREVDTDNELTRYMIRLLQNDAVPRGVLTIPQGVPVSPADKETIKQDWRLKFGGLNRGDISVLSGGMQYQRVGLDMAELALDALHGVPEARIASAYGVPAIVAGLNIGLTRSTYSNFEEARKMFTEQTLVPLWRAMASEIQQSVVPLFRRPCYVDFDLKRVAALNENTTAIAQWVVNAWDKGLITRNQALTRLGEGQAEDGTGDAYKAAPPAPAPTMLPTAPQDGSQSDTAPIQEGRQHDRTNRQGHLPQGRLETAR
jgi:HK97 family phage portal protein